VVSANDEIRGLQNMLECIHGVTHRVDFSDGVGPFGLGISEAVADEFQRLVVTVLGRKKRVGVDSLVTRDVARRQLVQVPHEAFDRCIDIEVDRMSICHVEQARYCTDCIFEGVEGVVTQWGPQHFLLVDHQVERLTNQGIVPNERMEVVRKTEVRMHLLGREWTRDLEDSSLSLREMCNCLVGDQKPMKLDFGEAELTLGSFDDEVVLVKGFEGLAKVYKMVFEGVGSNSAVIEVADKKLIKIISEDFVGHEEVVPSGDGCGTKRTLKPSEGSKLALESEVLVGTWVDIKLVIAQLVVDDREVALAFEELEHVLEVGNRILIVLSMLVYGPVVDAHAPFVIFVDHDNVAGEEGNATCNNT